MQHIDLSTLFITHDIDEAILLSDRIYILNGTPGTIKEEIMIREKKPRAEDFSLSEEFLEYKRQIISKLWQKMCAEVFAASVKKIQKAAMHIQYNPKCTAVFFWLGKIFHKL